MLKHSLLVLFTTILISAFPAFAGDAVIFNGDYVKALKANLKLSDTAYVVTGTADPTVTATDGPKGSLYLRQTPAGDGAAYVKIDNGVTTGWQQVRTDDGTLSINASVITNASGDLATITGSTGQVVAGNTGSAPSFQTLSVSNVGASPSASAGSFTGTALTLQPADGTHPGLVSTTTQTFGGVKTFANNVIFSANVTNGQSVDTTTTGANANLAHTTSYIKLTNVSLTSLATGTTPTLAGHEFYIENGTGSSITIVNNYGSPPGGTSVFVTGSGADYVLPNGAIVMALWNGTTFNLVDSIAASISGTLPVSKGGTGQTTLTNHGVLVGQGTSGIAATTVGTTGQVLTGVTGGDPVWAAPATSGTVTSVDMSGGTTGLTYTGGPITSSGTITTAGTLSAANGGTGVANNAAATLTRTGNFDLNLTTSAATALTLPTSGTVATLAGTEAFTNKDYQGGTASNTSRLTVPSASFATLDGLTDKAATLGYDTTSNNMLVNDGTNWVPTSSANSTSGQKNYIIAGANNATGWTASGAGMTVATTTTSADLPRNVTTKSGIVVTPVSGTTDYVQYCWTIDASDVSTKLMLQFAQLAKSGYASNDVEVRVYSFASANCGSTATRLSLSTDTSTPTSGLPNLTGTYATTFDTTTTLNYGVRFYRTAGTTAIVMSDFFVGVGQPVQSAIVGPWNTWTPTGSWSTNTTYTGKWRRVGDAAEISVKVATSGAPTSASLTVNNPTGFTTDTSALVNTTANDRPSLGRLTISDSGLTIYDGFVAYSSSTATALFVDESDLAYTVTAPITQTAPMTFGSGDSITANYTIPVAEWAGTGTVNLVNNAVEYAFNTGLADANDTTSFGYGPAGTVIQNAALAAARTRLVRFSTPVLPTDLVTLEVSADQVSWQPLSFNSTMLITNNFTSSNVAVDTGFGITGISGTDVTVTFRRYRIATNAWTTDIGYWRVKKQTGAQTVGFALASANSNGLIAGVGTQTIGGRITGGNSKVRVSRNSSQSIADSTDTVVVFNSEQLDTNNEYDTGTGLFTASATGYYMVNCGIYFDDTLSSGQLSRVLIQKNGSSTRVWPVTSAGSNAPSIQTFDIVSASVGDTIACAVYQNSGSSKNIQGTDTTRTVMTINQMF